MNQNREKMTQRREHQTLLFDADDTLWENNIYFERAIAAFISYLDHQVHTPEEVRAHLNQCEHATIAQFGYGVRSFQRSLIACFEQLTATEITSEKHTRIVAFSESISTHEIELLSGVEETLRKLSQRHRLFVVTKGNPEEQNDKVVRSGLTPYFAAIEVLAEKNTEAYRDLQQKYAFEPAATWMIGNSPKSDINPSLAAGLNAVFLPHDFTWVLEHETIERPQSASGKLLELSSFPQLLLHF